MKQSIINKLNQINYDFYQQKAHSFSSSRQFPWPGWSRTLNNINPNLKHKVIDVGCGNGRWRHFLHQSKFNLESYLGIDISQELLNKAVTSCQYPNTYWLQIDLLKFAKYDLPNITTPATLIGCFGIIHHIPSTKTRIELLNKLLSLLQQKGILAISFWQYHNDPRFTSKLINWSRLSLTESMLEPGDKLLSWQNDIHTPRYVHVFNDLQINELISHIPNVQILDDYKNDGKSKDLNRYIILQKK